MAESLTQALVRARQKHHLLHAADWVGAVTSAEEAYMVQDQVAAALDWFGSAPAQYWKSGGASREVTLTHAGLAPQGVRSSPASLGDFPFFAYAMESEIALRLGADVTPQQAATLTHQQAEHLVDAMAVSIELVDWRWQERKQAPSLLRLADAQSHGALVLGEWQPYGPRDWAAQACRTTINGEQISNVTGTLPLVEPAWLLPCWLRHCTRHGATVRAGTVVTTGSWVGLIEAKVGDLVRVEFPGIGDAEVRL